MGRQKKPENGTDASAAASVDRWPVPPEWVWAKITNLGNLKLGKQLTSGKRPGTRSTPYIRTANITLDGLDLTTVSRMDLTARERQTLRLARGDILVADASGSATHVGRSAIWNEEVPDCCFQNHVIRFRPHALRPEYALIAFRYLHTSGVFARMCHGVGIQHLGASRLAQMELPVPGDAEQGRIVEETNRRLEHVKNAVASMESALLGVEEQLAAALEATATGQLGSPSGGTADGAGPAPPAGVEPLAKVALPASWKWVQVEEAGEVKLGRQRSPKHEQGDHVVPYLRVANVYENRIDTSDVLSMNFTPEEQTAYRLQTGDILLNEGQSAELVGRPAIYRGDPPSVCFQNTLVRFRALDALNPEFALIVFRYYLRSGVFRTIARWSTNIAHLGRQRFAELPFPLPPRAEQDRLVTLFTERERRLDEQRATIRASMGGTEQMRREILEAAVRGGLRSRASGEESPARMLERLGPPPKEQRPARSEEDESEEAAIADDRKNLVAVLSRTGGRATAEDLFVAAGYDRDQTREVEAFYLVLRDALGKTIRHAGSEGGRVVYEVTPDAT